MTKTINFSELSDAVQEGFPTLDAGEYNLEVLESEFTHSKSGNPMIVLTLIEPDTKIRVRDYLTLTSKAFFKMKEFMTVTGVKPPEGNVGMDSDEFATFVEDLTGLEVTALIEVRDYTNNNGEKAKSNGVKKYLSEKAAGAKRKKSRTL